MSDIDLDMQIQGQARDKAFNDFILGNGYNNPHLEGSSQFVWYKDEWERLEYEYSQQRINQCEEYEV